MDPNHQYEMITDPKYRACCRLVIKSNYHKPWITMFKISMTVGLKFTVHENILTLLRNPTLV